ncbi:MAG: DUF192 domain-containing protein [bacterium]|nr:DUF192 domain-containing protein [bacterium]
MAKILFLGALILLVLAIAAFLFIPKKMHSEFPRGKLDIGGVILNVEIADTAGARSIGLSGHAPLADNEGMYFIFPIPAIYPFWMKGMIFPIDVVWLRGEKIVGIAENAAVPGSGKLEIYSPPSLVDRVLEINAGMAKKLGLVEGGMVRVPDL